MTGNRGNWNTNERKTERKEKETEEYGRKNDMKWKNIERKSQKRKETKGTWKKRQEKRE